MPVCCGCTSPVEDYSMGLLIKPVYFERSRKSGRFVAKGDHFPDGSTEKFLCTECLPSVADLIGLFEPGFDFPEECTEPLGAADIIQEDSYGRNVHRVWPGNSSGP